MLKKIVLSVVLLMSGYELFAQLGSDSTRRPIVTAVQFLQISPDARRAGMGDAGVASSSDANSAHWNPALLAFAKQNAGFSISYTPWLQNLVNDMWISYLSGYKRINKTSTVAASMRYFNMGELQFTDVNGNPIRDFNPQEFAFDATYSFQLSPNLSLGGSARFVNSNLAGNFSGGSTNTNSKPGRTAAVDLGIYYKNTIPSITNFEADWAFGANISNVGAKISYTDPSQKDFIPTNLRIGGAFNGQFDQFNRVSFHLDFNKLLVPTPQYVTSSGTQGKPDNDITMINGILRSFTDAPDGFKEEIKEVIVAAGVEYWYNNLLSLRAGYFNETKLKGARQYFTVGLGVKYQALALDFAYLIPRAQNHPLANTLRFTLLFNFGGKKTKSDNDVVPEEISE